MFSSSQSMSIICGYHGSLGASSYLQSSLQIPLMCLSYTKDKLKFALSLGPHTPLSKDPVSNQCPKHPTLGENLDFNVGKYGH